MAARSVHVIFDNRTAHNLLKLAQGQARKLTEEAGLVLA